MPYFPLRSPEFSPSAFIYSGAVCDVLASDPDEQGAITVWLPSALLPGAPKGELYKLILLREPLDEYRLLSRRLVIDPAPCTALSALLLRLPLLRPDSSPARLHVDAFRAIIQNFDPALLALAVETRGSQHEGDDRHFSLSAAAPHLLINDVPITIVPGDEATSGLWVEYGGYRLTKDWRREKIVPAPPAVQESYWKPNVDALIAADADPYELATWHNESESYYFPDDWHRYSETDLARIYREWKEKHP